MAGCEVLGLQSNIWELTPGPFVYRHNPSIKVPNELSYKSVGIHASNHRGFVVRKYLEQLLATFLIPQTAGEMHVQIFSTHFQIHQICYNQGHLR